MPIFDVSKLSASDITSLRSILGIQPVESYPTTSQDDEVLIAEKDLSTHRPNVDADTISDSEYVPFEQGYDNQFLPYEQSSVQPFQTRDTLVKGFSPALFQLTVTRIITFYLRMKLIGTCQN